MLSIFVALLLNDNCPVDDSGPCEPCIFISKPSVGQLDIFALVKSSLSASNCIITDIFAFPILLNLV